MPAEALARRTLFYDIWSNIHYGYVGRAAGFDSETLQKGATAGDKVAGTNDVGDEIAVRIGTQLYDRYRPEELRPEHIQQAILDAMPEFEAAGATQLGSYP